MTLLDPDRLFPLDARSRGLARALFDAVETLPIVSPHGHCDPAWFAEDAPFPDPARLFVVPDHYVFRMLRSRGVPLESLGVARVDGGAGGADGGARDGPPVERDGRTIWRTFAEHFHLLLGTPSRLWIEHALEDVFGVEERLDASSADRIYDRIAGCLEEPEFRPRALFERFRIEALATTESALDPLAHHEAIRASGWDGRVLTTYRPDDVVDPDAPGFAANVARLGELTGEDVSGWEGYLAAHRSRRAFFRERGCTATDHGHPSAATADLSPADAAKLYAKALSGDLDAREAERFRGQALTEMARMSLDDGLVMQLHPGSHRNHSPTVHARFGPNAGFDIPVPTDYVRALKPLLDAVGTDDRLTLIVFCLDESAHSRELAPLAGAYPALRLGPPWWFLDSPEGMRRFREATVETAGFFNTVGFNDDTRAFCSIPARHDVARRVDSAYLATLVATGRLAERDAFELAPALAVGLAREAYRL